MSNEKLGTLIIMHYVYKDGKPVAEFPSAPECAAYILMQGWIDTVERYGMVWAKGVEIRKGIK